MSRDRCKTPAWSGRCSLDTPFLPTSRVSLVTPSAVSHLSSPACCLPTSVQVLCHYPLKALSCCRKSIHPCQRSKGVCCSSYCPATRKVIILITSFKRETKCLLILSHLCSLSPLTSQNKDIFLKQKLQGMESVEGLFTCFMSLLFKKCFMQLSKTKMRIL